MARKCWWAWVDSNYRPHPYQLPEDYLRPALMDCETLRFANVYAASSSIGRCYELRPQATDVDLGVHQNVHQSFPAPKLCSHARWGEGGKPLPCARAAPSVSLARPAATLARLRSGSGQAHRPILEERLGPAQDCPWPERLGGTRGLHLPLVWMVKTARWTHAATRYLLAGWPPDHRRKLDAELSHLSVLRGRLCNLLLQCLQDCEVCLGVGG
jgi:hypothetical protein